MFGFRVYKSISKAGGNDGRIYYPAPGENVEGGQVVIAVDDRDRMKIRSTNRKEIDPTGALLIRSAGGNGWGDGGDDCLAYAYVRNGPAEDWWWVIKGEWVETGVFKAGG